MDEGITSEQLLRVADEVHRNTSEVRLLKNDLGNLVIFTSPMPGEYLGFIDLHTGEVEWISD